jgi:hypothetical protein
MPADAATNHTSISNFFPAGYADGGRRCQDAICTGSEDNAKCGGGGGDGRAIEAAEFRKCVKL